LDPSSVISRTTHFKPEHDPETSYNKPTEIIYEWKGTSLLSDAPGAVEGKLFVDLGTNESPNGLIEKVDVLAEIPYVLKMAVNYVAGTKPYIYQWVNPAKLTVSSPATGSRVTVGGVLYNEATFIS